MRESKVVVVIATLDKDSPVFRERYVTDSIGRSLEAHAPDPAPGARFEVEYVGRARVVERERTDLENELGRRLPSTEEEESPPSAQVTDEMVEQAETARRNGLMLGGSPRETMRAALEAALSPPHTETRR